MIIINSCQEGKTVRQTVSSNTKSAIVTIYNATWLLFQAASYRD